jgi:hypothetical protein
MNLSETGLSRLFKHLEICAATGARCPQSLPHGPLTKSQNQGIGVLARRGRIKVDIYAHNWRVVTMCDGPHFGKSTAMPPYSCGGPYKTIQRIVHRNSGVTEELTPG